MNETQKRNAENLYLFKILISQVTKILRAALHTEEEGEGAEERTKTEVEILRIINSLSNKKEVVLGNKTKIEVEVEVEAEAEAEVEVEALLRAETEVEALRRAETEVEALLRAETKKMNTSNVKKQEGGEGI